jgi:predicted ribosome quality control (RQC) complex YloA/Tae2 family protein
MLETLFENMEIVSSIENIVFKNTRLILQKNKNVTGLNKSMITKNSEATTIQRLKTEINDLENERRDQIIYHMGVFLKTLSITVKTEKYEYLEKIFYTSFNKRQHELQKLYENVSKDNENLEEENENLIQKLGYEDRECINTLMDKIDILNVCIESANLEFIGTVLCMF